MAGAELTIDELARRVGMTVRNVRAHQSRGLLDAPEVRGRTGYYGDDHVERLELIKQLQADGYSLELVGRLLERSGAAGLTRFTREMRTPFDHEATEVLTAAELAERFGPADPERLDRATRLGILRRVDDDRVEALSPTLLRAGAELAALGVDADRALDVLEAIRAPTEEIAHAFVSLFLRSVVRPALEAHDGDASLDAVTDALERLRPLASESLLATFQLAMTDAAEAGFEREIAALAAGGTA